MVFLITQVHRNTENKHRFFDAALCIDGTWGAEITSWCLESNAREDLVSQSLTVFKQKNWSVLISFVTSPALSFVSCYFHFQRLFWFGFTFLSQTQNCSSGWHQFQFRHRQKDKSKLKNAFSLKTSLGISPPPTKKAECCVNFNFSERLIIQFNLCCW